MEKIAVLAIPVLLGVFLLRLLVRPMALALKLALHGAGGVACLTLVNAMSAISGIAVPINAVTVLTAGFLGLPGIAFLTALEMV